MRGDTISAKKSQTLGMSTSRSSPHSNISCNLKEREGGRGRKGGREGERKGGERERGEGEKENSIIIYTGIYKINDTHTRKLKFPVILN